MTGDAHTREKIRRGVYVTSTLLLPATLACIDDRTKKHAYRIAAQRRVWGQGGEAARACASFLPLVRSPARDALGVSDVPFDGS